MRKEPERRLRLLRIAQLLRDELRARGFAVLPGETAIVPVVIREEIDLCRLCKTLLEEGIYINPVLRPAAAQNLLRISCTAAHTEQHVERLVRDPGARIRRIGHRALSLQSHSFRQRGRACASPPVSAAQR